MQTNVFQQTAVHAKTRSYEKLTSHLEIAEQTRYNTLKPEDIRNRTKE